MRPPLFEGAAGYAPDALLASLLAPLVAAVTANPGPCPLRSTWIFNNCAIGDFRETVGHTLVLPYHHPTTTLLLP